MTNNNGYVQHELNNIKQQLEHDINNRNTLQASGIHRGLINTHNTCFASSVLQSLICIPLFYHLIKHIQDSNIVNEYDEYNNNNSIIYDIIQFANTYAGKQQNIKKSISKQSLNNDKQLNSNNNNNHNTDNTTSTDTVNNVIDKQSNDNNVLSNSDVKQDNQVDQRLSNTIVQNLSISDDNVTTPQLAANDNTNANDHIADDSNTTTNTDNVDIINNRNHDTTTSCNKADASDNTATTDDTHNLSKSQLRKLRQQKSKQGINSNVTQQQSNTKTVSSIERIKLEAAAKRKASRQQQKNQSVDNKTDTDQHNNNQQYAPTTTITDNIQSPNNHKSDSTVDVSNKQTDDSISSSNIQQNIEQSTTIQTNTTTVSDSRSFNNEQNQQQITFSADQPISNDTSIPDNISVTDSITSNNNNNDDGFQTVSHKPSKSALRKQRRNNMQNQYNAQLPTINTSRASSSQSSHTTTTTTSSRPITPLSNTTSQLHNNNQLPPKHNNTNNNTMSISVKSPRQPLQQPLYHPTHSFIAPIQNILNNFWSSHKSIQHTQMDAHEFLHYILDNIHTQLSKLCDDNNYTHNGLSMHSNHYIINNANNDIDEWQEIGKKNKVYDVNSSIKFSDTLISMLFNGRIRSALSSRQSTARLNIQPFYSISLDIALPNIHSINQAIDNYMSRTEISGYKISQNNKGKLNESTATQITTFDNLPYILVLQLNRFNVVAQDSIYSDQYFASKLNKNIRYDSELVISNKYVSGFNINKQTNTYTLCSIIVHHGNQLNSGHYTAYIRDLTLEQQNNNNDNYHQQVWFHADDGSISRASSTAVYSQPAYLLFYQKK